MKLMTLKQYMNMSKPALIRKITKTLRAMPKVKLARLCYNITKSKLPRLTIRQRKRKARGLRRLQSALVDPRYMGGQKIPLLPYESISRKRKVKRKTKRKFSRKQLAAQRLFAKRARAGTLKRRRR